MFRKAKSFFNRVVNNTDVTSDRCGNIAVWYLYRTLHERNDWAEIEVSIIALVSTTRLWHFLTVVWLYLYARRRIIY